MENKTNNTEIGDSVHTEISGRGERASLNGSLSRNEDFVFVFVCSENILFVSPVLEEFQIERVFDRSKSVDFLFGFA